MCVHVNTFGDKRKHRADLRLVWREPCSLHVVHAPSAHSVLAFEAAG